MIEEQKRFGRPIRKRRQPLPPVMWLLILLLLMWLSAELVIFIFSYLSGAKAPFEERYADAEEWMWTDPMPLLVTCGKKEMTVEHTVEKWYFVVSQVGMSQRGGTTSPFREPTTEEGKKSPKLRRTGESITLSFPVEPDTLKVYCWEAGKENEKNELPLTDGVLRLEPGKWIYGVEAEWTRRIVKGGSWGGRAWYCFRATGS